MLAGTRRLLTILAMSQLKSFKWLCYYECSSVLSGQWSVVSHAVNCGLIEMPLGTEVGLGWVSVCHKLTLIDVFTAVCKYCDLLRLKQCMICRHLCSDSVVFQLTPRQCYCGYVFNDVLFMCSCVMYFN